MARGRFSSLRCVVTGHRWEQESDVERPFPVLRCRRCGHLQELAIGVEPTGILAEREGRRGAELGGLAPTRFRR